ncbi:Uncharacterized protein APZ42_017850 [Daphnia magna]|uniref:Uncharacterized protein n=1 Tax=Daphnia magna TaxID=35525 RepID=A0A162CJ49_9CRUS|nr:Uncharacterized protein APZ42_017850 [Daphnia magna]
MAGTFLFSFCFLMLSRSIRFGGMDTTSLMHGKQRELRTETNYPSRMLFFETQSTSPLN